VEQPTVEGTHLARAPGALGEEDEGVMVTSASAIDTRAW